MNRDFTVIETVVGWQGGLWVSAGNEGGNFRALSKSDHTRSDHTRSEVARLFLVMTEGQCWRKMATGIGLS